MTFLEAVNAILVKDGVIRGDDDAITAFSDTQHVANIRWAKEAVKDELNHLRAHYQWEGTRKSAVLTTVAGTRVYQLATNFTRFDEEKPWLLEEESDGTSKNIWVVEYPGGIEALRANRLDFDEQQGTPIYWYWDPTSTSVQHQIALYQVPDAVKYYRYWYVDQFKSWTAAEGDSLPFEHEWEAEVFTQACVERFKFIRTPLLERNRLYPNGLVRYPPILEAESTLLALIRNKPQRQHYGRRHSG